jgi:hypothetical protein
VGITTITSAVVVHRGERYEGDQVTNVVCTREKDQSLACSTAEYEGWWIAKSKKVYGWTVSGEIPVLWSTREHMSESEYNEKIRKER